MSSRDKDFRKELDPLNIVLVASVIFVLLFYLTYYIFGLGNKASKNLNNSNLTPLPNSDNSVSPTPPIPTSTNADLEQFFKDEDPFQELCAETGTGSGTAVIYGNTVCYQ